MSYKRQYVRLCGCGDAWARGEGSHLEPPSDPGLRWLAKAFGGAENRRRSHPATLGRRRPPHRHRSSSHALTSKEGGWVAIGSSNRSRSQSWTRMGEPPCPPNRRWLKVAQGGSGLDGGLGEANARGARPAWPRAHARVQRRAVGVVPGRPSLASQGPARAPARSQAPPARSRRRARGALAAPALPATSPDARLASWRFS
jgi:hypothetical protein